MSLKEFCRELNSSPWMGSVCEVGIGLPFQAQFVNEPGASRTILFTHCPYSKAFQPNDIRRSVSHEMAVRYAWTDFDKLCYNEGTQDDHLFSIATSAAHKTMGERGESHGWTSVVARASSKAEAKSYSIHWRLKKSWMKRKYIKHEFVGHEELPVGRAYGGAHVASLIRWFLNKVLLNKWETWEEAIAELPYDPDGILQVDIIRAPSITMEEHLLLAKENVPLVYHHGEFKRPVDYIRQYNRIYRGSFNPPTKSHVAIGEGSMFEVSLDNARKGRVTYKELTHRIRMVDTCERPVLITTGYPLFVELQNMLKQYGANSVEYPVGVDTFNAIVDEKYIPEGGLESGFFDDFLAENDMQTARFLVFARGDLALTENKYSEAIDHRDLPCEGTDVSSTAVRNGNLSYVSKRVARYIKANNLYGLGE